jgi:hypothetical protein
MMFEQCKAVLLREAELIKKTALAQNVVWTAVVNREWTDFEAHVSAMNALGGEFASLEAEREGLFTELKGALAETTYFGDEKGRFYTLIARLPAEQRNELTGIYRNLKIEAIKVRLSNDALLSYLNEARATMEGFLELAFPDRGGRIYTPRGTPVSHDMRSMVLNRSF